MEYNEDFARLEQFVERLIDSYNQLKNVNSDINALLLEKEQEIIDLQEKVKDLQDDRNVMLNRVSGLIERIDGWEKKLDQEGSEQNSNLADTETQKKQSKKSSSLIKGNAGQSPGSALR